MRVTILDLDWYNKLSFIPDITCMKISSYYKQKGFIVNFPINNFDLLCDYDFIFISRNLTDSVIPKEVSIVNDKVVLLGKTFKYYERYQSDIDKVIAMCRPDYLLYPKHVANQMQNANYIQFYYQDELLNTFQDYHKSGNTQTLNVVTDAHFWDKSVQNIKACINYLKNDKNIVFLQPIQLKTFIENHSLIKLFGQLKLCKKHKLTFQNNCDIKDYKKVIILLIAMQHAKIPFNIVSFNMISFNHNQEPSRIIEDVERCLQLANLAKKYELPIRFIPPARTDSVMWHYFENIAAWSINDFKSSYIEYCARYTCYHYNVDVYTAYYNKLLHFDSIITSCILLAMRYNDIIEKYCYRKWGENFLSPHINFNKILGDKRI